MENFFKSGRFAHLWLSQLLSQITINIVTFLVLVRLFEQTGSSIASSFVWLAYAAPAIIVGPIAAATVDLVDRRKTLMFTNLGQAIIVLLFAFLFKKYLFLSYVTVLLYSFFNQFYVPAEAATLPKIVKKEKLSQANAVFFLTQQAAIVLGIGFAGISKELFDYQITFLIAGVLLLIAFASVSLLPKMKPEEKISKDWETGILDFFVTISEGYKFIKSSRILFPFLFMMVLYVSITTAVVNLPVLAKDVIRIPASYSGFVMVVPAGVGAILGSFLLSKVLHLGLRKKRVIELSLLVLGLCIYLLILGVPQIANYWGRIYSTIFLFGVAGMSFVNVIIVPLTYLQESTPSELMGRVFGNFWFLTTVATILPVLFSATVTEVFGVGLVFIILGTGYFTFFLISRFYGDKLLNG